MKRRNFIGASLAILATPVLPSTGIGFRAPDPKIWNTATLTALMEKQFACQMGPASALFDMLDGKVLPAERVTLQVPRYPNQYYTDWAPTPEGATRYIHETYACAIEGGSAEEAEARLAKHFYDHFSQLPAGPLVWRVQPSFASEELVEYGKTWATQAAVEDGVKDLTNKPADVELDYMSGTYKYVTKRTQLHKMRMRLVLPHLYDHSDETVALPELFKPEGALIKRIT